MTLALTLLCRVIRRRMKLGEDPEKILEDYPKLTEEDRKIILKRVLK